MKNQQIEEAELLVDQALTLLGEPDKAERDR
jgi:hypothetical protein